jgi:hypothetical protein
MVMATSLSLIHASFFFVDVVGLSDPTMSTKTQIKKIETLNRCISECEIFQQTPKEMMMMLPTGDGMCIGFLQGPELPLLLAIELHKKLAEYNKGKIPSETVRVRVGLHNGNCFIVNDLLGNKNIWGPGIILARRVMDFGDDGHILLSANLAESLRELSDEYKSVIKPVHDFVLKHGTTMLVYTAYGDGFGNKSHPTKGEAMRSKYGEEMLQLQKTTLYPYIDVSLTVVDPTTMLVQHKRTYGVMNISNEPIKHVLHGIATDVPKYSVNDLNVQVFDEKHRELKISSINMDKPDCKEFTTLFSEPICKGDIGKEYTLMYEVEEPERYFENAFLIDCQQFSLNFQYPINSGIKRPVLYEVNQEKDEKKLSKLQPTIEHSGKHEVVGWKFNEITKGQTYRIEW